MNDAVIYIRVSTQEQVTNHSLDSQDRLCREYCAANSMQVIRAFREEGESAKTANRPVLQAMLDYLRTSGKRDGVTTLVVLQVNRLARNTEDHAMIRFQLRNAGVRIRAAQENIDETPEGKLVENLMASFAQFDNDTRARRTKTGMFEALRKGRWLWRPPLGYRTPMKVDGAPSLEPHAEVGRLVQEVFEYAAKGGRTKADARNYATSLGLLAGTGKPLSPERFNTLLRNPIYYGWMVSESLDFAGWGDFEPIVSQDLFDRVQRATETNRASTLSYRTENPDFPLRRVVKCPQCKGPLTGSWSTGRSKKYPYYRCPDSSCHVNVTRENLEARFVDFLTEESVPQEIFDLFDAVVRDSVESRSATSSAQNARLEVRLRDLEGKKQKLFDAFIQQEIIDQETYEAQRVRLEAQQSQIRDQLATSASGAIDLDCCLAFGRQLLTDLPECWNRLKPLHRPRFVAAMYPGGLIITDGKIGTARIPWHRLGSDGSGTANSRKVPPSGIEPLLPG